MKSIKDEWSTRVSSSKRAQEGSEIYKTYQFPQGSVTVTRDEFSRVVELFSVLAKLRDSSPGNEEVEASMAGRTSKENSRTG